MSSPPSQRRRLEASSPSNDLAPLDSSDIGVDNSLLTSPREALASEIDLSSPLNYGTPGSVSTVGGSVGVGATPIRHRPDVRSDRRMRQVNVGPGGDPPSETERSERSDPVSEVPQGPQLVIWGTDVVVSQCNDKFRSFITTFIDTSIADDEQFAGVDPNQPYYLQRLDDINAIAEPFLNINCGHLKEFDAQLYRQLLCYPQEVIPTFDMAVNEMFFERFANATLEHQIQVRPYNADKTSNMRSLNPEDIDQLITISGMSSAPLP